MQLQVHRDLGTTDLLASQRDRMYTGRQKMNSEEHEYNSGTCAAGLVQ